MDSNWLVGKLCFLSLCFTATGCALTPEQFAEEVEITGIKFDSTIKYSGPVLRSHGKSSYTDDIQLTYLYAERARDSDVIRYFVRADVLYPSGWRFYQYVRFADAGTTFVKTRWFADSPCVPENCGYKSYSVQFPVTLSRLLKDPELEFRLETLTGKTNEFLIPRNYIEGFVMASDKYRKFRTSAQMRIEAVESLAANSFSGE